MPIASQGENGIEATHGNEVRALRAVRGAFVRGAWLETRGHPSRSRSRQEIGWIYDLRLPIADCPFLVADLAKRLDGFKFNLQSSIANLQ